MLLQKRRRIESRTTRHGLRRQVEHAVSNPVAECLDSREERGHGFPDARRRGYEKIVPVLHRGIRPLDELRLPAADGTVGKRHFLRLLREIRHPPRENLNKRMRTCEKRLKHPGKRHPRERCGKRNPLAVGTSQKRQLHEDQRKLIPLGVKMRVDGSLREMCRIGKRSQPAREGGKGLHFLDGMISAVKGDTIGKPLHAHGILAREYGQFQRNLRRHTRLGNGIGLIRVMQSRPVLRR